MTVRMRVVVLNQASASLCTVCKTLAYISMILYDVAIYVLVRLSMILPKVSMY